MQRTASSADPGQGAEITSDSERVDPLPPEARAVRYPSEPGESVFAGENWDEREAARAAAHRELEVGVLGAAVDKLSAIGLVSAGVLTGYLLSLATLVPRGGDTWQSFWPTGAGLLAAAITASLGLYAVTRLKLRRPQVVHDVGYLYLFVLALLLGLLRHSNPWPSTEFARQVSPVVIPILAFGALIPAPPSKALLVLFGAAAMDPLAFYLMRSHEHMPRAQELILLFASPFLAALVAQRISLVVHRLSEGIVKAREVGSYRLVERLGVGGMAEVWRADHRMLARPAAVKLIRPKVLVDHGPTDAERLLRLFAREARATASLRSPHTIQVYDFGITREGAFYYVMELLDGIDLKTLVDKFGPQPAERVAYLLRQACQSLDEAHQRAFVHRDVKPANIYTCHYGVDFDFVKVLDFGLVLDRHPTAEELEDDRRFVGTPAIMAPEMVRFHAPVDARADIYALGCVGYWLLTGKRVFDAGTRHDLLVMHAHQKPLPPSKRVALPMHPGLEAVIMGCLEKNPNRRPQTARELTDSLDSLVFEQPWTEERAKLWWQRNLERDNRDKPQGSVGITQQPSEARSSEASHGDGA
jgi:serine/threonine protein kinase